MLKLQQFLKEYFDTEYEKFTRILKERGKKEAFLQAFISGFEYNPQITLDLDDNILQISNLHRYLPQRLEEFLKHWQSEG